MARTSTLAHADSRRAVIGEMHFLYRPRWHTGDVKQGRLILFLPPHVELSNFDLPDRRGYLTPSPTQNAILTAIKNRTQGTVESRPCYIKSNTGDHSEPPPLLFQPTTGNNKESSPPVHKTKHRGQWTVFPPLLCETEHRGR